MRTFLWFTLLLLFLVPLSARAIPSDKNSRDNGVEWLHFGPGVIDDCKRIDLSFEFRGGKFTLIESDEKFSAVKDWVKQRFGKRLNLSPTKKCYESVAFTQRVALYSSETKDPQKLLFSVPLTPTTLGVEKRKCDVFVQELRALVERH